MNRIKRLMDICITAIRGSKNLESEPQPPMRYGIAGEYLHNASTHIPWLVNKYGAEVVRPYTKLILVSSSDEHGLQKLRGFRGGVTVFVCDTFWRGRFVQEYRQMFENREIIIVSFPASECRCRP